METYTLPLDDLTGKFVSLRLYANVKNTPEIRKKLLSGELKCCVLKASLVVDPFHVAVAANKAALREHNRQLTTKSVFAEILYVMSSSSNISLSLAKFGIHDNDENFIVAKIHGKNEETSMNEIGKFVQGEALPVRRINEFTDVNLVKKTYKIDDVELGSSSLLDSVVSRIGGDYSVSLK